MRRALVILIILSGASWLWFKGIAYLPQPRKQLTIYGSDECERCRQLKKELNKVGIHYTFKDVNQSDFYCDEMWVEIWKINARQEAANLPVVIINEKLLITPPPEKVIAVYRRPVLSWTAIHKRWIKRENPNSNTYISIH